MVTPTQQAPILTDDLQAIISADDAQDQHPDGICICIDPDTQRPAALDPEEAATGTRCVFVQDGADDDALAPAVAALTEFRNPVAVAINENDENDLDDNSDNDDDD